MPTLALVIDMNVNRRHLEEAADKLSIGTKSIERAKAVLASGLLSLIDLCDQDRLAVSLVHDIVKNEGRARLGGGYVN